MTFEYRRLDNADQTHDARNGLSVDATQNQVQTPARLPRFEQNEFVVYAAHGVGQITAIEVQTVAGSSLEFFVIYFKKSKMKVRVPLQKANSAGIRKLSSSTTLGQVRRTLSQTAPRQRTNWARLAKEYESKLKSGDVIGLAEVMRDLYRRTAESDRSYSDRQLYAAALDRLSAEVALVEQITEEQAVVQLESILTSRPVRVP